MNSFAKVISTSFNDLQQRMIKFLQSCRSDVRMKPQAAPYGVDSSPIIGMVAIHGETTVKGNSVIVGYINKNQLARTYNDRNLLKDYRYLESGRFRPYTISKPLMQRTEEIYKELSTDFDNIEITKTLNSQALSSLSRMISDMSRVPLGESMDNYINVNDYLIGDKPSLLGPRSEAPTNVQPLPVQPQPNPQVVSKPPVTPNQQTGLTATETGLLTDAEKAIRLRQQGLA
jgi:hypothetical protein